MSSVTAECIPPHLIEQAKQADVRELAARYTVLRPCAGSKELAGPCPKCGGKDRFYCQAAWFSCRQCHATRGDAIEFLRWLQPGLSFVAAVTELAGPPAGLPRSKVKQPPPRAAPAQQSAAWRQSIAAHVTSAQERLWAPEGEPGRIYLEQRALEPATWLAYGLGYTPDAPLPGTQGKQRAPAIVLPWQSQTRGVYAVRYRFLKAQHYEDRNGRERVERLVAATGSQFSGKLFGGQALPESAYLPLEPDQTPAERFWTLLIIEGEINGMSCWQAAGETRLDVLSVGSESARLSAAAIQTAQRYGRVLVWADRTEVAQQLMQVLPAAYGVHSPPRKDADGHVQADARGKLLKLDANDMLKAGTLSGFLALARADAAQSSCELEGLLWGLWDAANLPAGIDTGAAQVCMRLAARVGKVVRLVEAEPGRWVVAFGGEECQEEDMLSLLAQVT